MDNIGYFSAKRLAMIKERSKRCVCKHCGSQLVLKRIIFSDFEEARVEIFCTNCDRIEFGVESQIYQNAKYFVENFKFNCFPDLSANERTKQLNIAKICEIMQWHLRNLGYLKDEGFVYPPSENNNHNGATLLFYDEDLEDDDEGFID